MRRCTGIDESMNKKIVISIALLSLISCAALVLASTKAEESPVFPLSSLSQYKVSNNVNEYIIDGTVDLQGKRLSLPQNTTLRFTGGTIINGTLKGDSTVLIANTFPIFDKIAIEGSWKIDSISTDLFKTTDELTAINITNLSSDKQLNHIDINSDIVVPIRPWSSNLIIKSHTHLTLNADIYTLPTEHQGGYCIHVDGCDITVDGNNHYLFGTLADPRQKECYEWLYGLNITEKSSNVLIENLSSWYFCGDGFYNAGSNITFNNVNAKFNGRQGLSITNGSNIRVLNSSFTYTGFYRICKSKGPGAGIDIEPNKDESVKNIDIDNCIITKNYRYMDGYVNDLEIYNADNCNVTISKCRLNGIYMGESSKITINDCIGLQTVFGVDNNVSNITMNSCGHPALSKKLQGLIKVQ